MKERCFGLTVGLLSVLVIQAQMVNSVLSGTFTEASGSVVPNERVWSRIRQPAELVRFRQTPTDFTGCRACNRRLCGDSFNQGIHRRGDERHTNGCSSASFESELAGSVL